MERTILKKLAEWKASESHFYVDFSDFSHTFIGFYVIPIESDALFTDKRGAHISFARDAESERSRAC